MKDTFDNSTNYLENIEHAYRPKSVSEIILPDRIKKPIMGMIEDGKFANALFYGSIAGTGKTSMALAICNDLGLKEGEDFRIWNGSTATTNVVNSEIPEFLMKASTRKKFVILDEFDNKTLSNAQSTFRNTLDKYSTHTSFIFTGNNIENINKAIISRCESAKFDFDQMGTHEEKVQLSREMTIRLYKIFEDKKSPIDKKYAKDIAVFVYDNLPSMRDILHTFNMIWYENDRKVDDRFVQLMKRYSINNDELIHLLKSKNLTNILRYAQENFSSVPKVIDILNKFVHDNITDPNVIVGIVHTLSCLSKDIKGSAHRAIILQNALVDVANTEGLWESVNVSNIDDVV